MDQSLLSLDEENRKLVERLVQINSETLKVCEMILANPSRYGSLVVDEANAVMELLIKNRNLSYP